MWTPREQSPYLNTSVGALGSSERSTSPLMALRGTDVKKKLPPKSTTSSTEMKNVPTGPTLPPSAVSKPGWILSGSPVDSKPKMGSLRTSGAAGVSSPSPARVTVTCGVRGSVSGVSPDGKRMGANAYVAVSRVPFSIGSRFV